MVPAKDSHLVARNKSKRRYQYFTYEAVMADCRSISKEIFGEENHSELVFHSTLYILSKFKKKYSFLKDKDRAKFMLFLSKIKKIDFNNGTSNVERTNK